MVTHASWLTVTGSKDLVVYQYEPGEIWETPILLKESAVHDRE
jgi:hypothetical protein